MDTAIDDLAFLTRSSAKVAVLGAVEREPQSRDALSSSVDAARVTLDRAIDALADRGWIEESADGYRTTAHGGVVAREYETLRKGIEAATLPAGGNAEGARGGRGSLDAGTDGGTTAGPGDEQASALAGTTPEAGAIGGSTDPTLDLLGFLARAPARIAVLSAVESGTRSRDALGDIVDVPRSTLRRNLAELDDRGLAERTNDHLELTARGADVVAGLERFRANVGAAHELAPVLSWLPLGEFEFDLARLAGATVVAADWDDPTASIHHVAERVAAADHARIVGRGAAREVIGAVRELTVDRGGRFEGVLDADALATIHEDPALREDVAAILDSSGGRIAIAEEPLPLFVVTVVDDDALVCGNDGGEPPHEAVECGDERVREWADGVVDAAWADAEPLDPAALER